MNLHGSNQPSGESEADHTNKHIRGAIQYALNYEFTLILKGSPELGETIADELFAAGCGDGTPGTSGGVFSIEFHRDADSLKEGINSAIANVCSAGYDVARVEINPVQPA